jgi:hypothetical protein
VPRGRSSVRQVIVLVVALGILIEIPLVAYILTRGDDAPSVAAPTESTIRGNVSLPLHPAAGTFKPDSTELASCSDQQCYEQAYGNIAYRQGPKPAFALLEKQYAGGADPNCHRVTHIIGAAVLARNDNNVSRTFAEGSSTCWSGYYHGVLERAFADVKSLDARTLGAKSRALCSDPLVRKSSWLSYQCLHGLGHGLMITTGYQLPLALDVCRQLAGEWDRTSCKGGAFMENFITSYGGESPWVRRDDPLYPCDWVAEGDKYTCYQQATTRIIRVVGLKWRTIAATCAEAEPNWVATCFGSFGQNASVNSARVPSKIVRLCALTRRYEGERECIRYAAMDIAGTYSNGRRASVLCKQSVAAVQAPCYEAIGRMLRHLRNTVAERRAECRSLSANRQHVAACIRGSTQVSSIPGLTR